MKLKMAENSLFAILLRSRWWISLAIACGFVLVSAALLPREYALAGALGGVPFAIIGAIALKRQWGAPSATMVEAQLARAAGMPWNEFAAALESAYRKAGYTVQRTTGGADFVLEKGGRTTLVSAKRWKAARQGVEPLRELDAARRAKDADAAVFLALGALSENADAFARQAPVRVVQGADLAVLLQAA
ncbi:restriction endonuclease [Pseudorhodoferax sp. Leaf274]|uniref:restriction endonuclease n=1 Tax=Pseudorhodoferax sp. Leaf274 TaxID=1736318 RepID=UPI0009E682EA|nr:restriction endonuclease [Pseudorhodoferax sp. Leaf274]